MESENEKMSGAVQILLVIVVLVVFLIFDKLAFNRKYFDTPTTVTDVQTNP